MPRAKPGKMDRVIGRRIRQRRKALGLAIGVQSQQLSKYEAGQNRIAASKLHELAYQLQMPVAWFFEE